jgi:hypothetical protein
MIAASGAGGCAYAPSMLPALRDPRGKPSLEVRLLAGLVVLGMVVLTAPLVVVPAIRWLVTVL